MLKRIKQQWCVLNPSTRKATWDTYTIQTGITRVCRSRKKRWWVPENRRTTWEKGLEKKMKIFAVGNTMEVGETPGDQSMVRVKDRALRKTKPTAAAGVQ